VSIAGSLLGDFALFWVGSRLLTARAVPWRQLGSGAAAGAVAWALLQAGGAIYVRHVLEISSNAYGTFAFVIGLLSFIYLAVLVAIVVAEANVVASKRLWPRSLTANDAAFPQLGGGGLAGRGAGFR
jgi:membrane protein